MSDFITTTELSDLIGRDVSADQGATDAIAGACEMIRTYTEQRFDLEPADTVTLDGSGTDSILLPQLPVNTVGTVTVDGGTITDYVLSDNGTLFRGTAGIRYSWPFCWPQGRQNITVTYSHGYGTAPSDYPDDLRAVARQLASRIVIQGVASFEVMGDQQIRYAANSTDFTNGEKMILDRYRRHY